MNKSCYTHLSAGVHDSFWTHAAHVDRMGEVLREEFVALHSRPLVPELVDSLKATHPHLAQALPPIPDLGSLELKDVKQSIYFFS